MKATPHFDIVPQEQTLEKTKGYDRQATSQDSQNDIA